MTELKKGKGPWTHRLLVHVFTGALAVLIYWLLGFVIGDIGSWPGPDYHEIEKQKLDAGLLQRSKDLAEQIQQTEREIQNQRGRQSVLRESTSESQRTMTQLLEFQRLSMDKGVTPTQQEQQALAEAEQLFLSNQKQFQVLNDKVAELSHTLRDLQDRQRATEKELQQAREPVQKEYDELRKVHDLKMAALKLAVLVPLLCVGVFLYLKKRESAYAPILYAFGIATVVKVGMVMHEYFPARYFKYVLILVALAIVARILVALLRTVAFPKPEWLLKQYREAYERFLCPVCEYPIRRGPLKYAFWTRRSLKKLATASLASSEPDAPYTCPMCGTALFEECPACHAIRHSLLPACQQCGNAKALDNPRDSSGPPAE